MLKTAYRDVINHARGPTKCTSMRLSFRLGYMSQIFCLRWLTGTAPNRQFPNLLNAILHIINKRVLSSSHKCGFKAGFQLKITASISKINVKKLNSLFTT